MPSNESKWEVIRKALLHGYELSWTEGDAGIYVKAKAALDILREQMEEHELLKTKVAEYEAGRHPDDQYLALMDENVRLREQVERLETVLRNVAFVTVHCSHGAKVRRILERAALSTEEPSDD